MKSAPAFTLIELLIVVAIIAILAAIAVPNFLEAQTRAKVSRAKADMRTLRGGVEAYAVDERVYPRHTQAGVWPGDVYEGLGNSAPIGYTLGYWVTTPVAYLSKFDLVVPFDFGPMFVDVDHATAAARLYGYTSSLFERSLMARAGADSMFTGPLAAAQMDYWQSQFGGYLFLCWGPMSREAQLATVEPIRLWVIPYDPTNGTTSWGRIAMSQRHGIIDTLPPRPPGS